MSRQPASPDRQRPVPEWLRSGVAISLTRQPTGVPATSSTAVSIGISIAENSIGQNTGHEVEATIDHSVVTATGNVTLSATSTAAVDAVAVGGSGSGSTGLTAKGVFSAAGAGAYAANNITETIDAHIAADSDVTTTPAATETSTSPPRTAPR